MTLQEFLNTNTVDDIVKETAVSDRFKDENGNILKFKIKAMTQNGFLEVKKKALFLSGGKEISDELFNCFVIIENTVEPSFKDAKSLESLSCSNSVEYLNKVMLAGEINSLSEAILKLSGFDSSIEELAEQVKN